MVESNASSPLSAEELIGTPITGKVVSAAITPAKCAAAPAPAIKILMPRLEAPTTYFRVRSGERCADDTIIS